MATEITRVTSQISGTVMLVPVHVRPCGNERYDHCRKANCFYHPLSHVSLSITISQPSWPFGTSEHFTTSSLIHCLESSNGSDEAIQDRTCCTVQISPSGIGVVEGNCDSKPRISMSICRCIFGSVNVRIFPVLRSRIARFLFLNAAIFPMPATRKVRVEFCECGIVAQFVSELLTC